MTASAARILVVDDAPVLREMIVATLELEGFRPIPYGDGQAAWNALPEVRPNLILCDVTMRGLDGFELLRRFRLDPALGAVPFVLMTAHAGPEAIRHAKDLGATGYLVKPFTPDQLVECIRRHLGPSAA